MTSDAVENKTDWDSLHGHQELPKLLEALDRDESPAALRERLTHLQQVLEGHFHEEAKPGGWFDELVQAEPANGSRIASLRQEHEDILDGLRGAVTTLDACLKALGSVADTVAEVRTVIQEHCDKEHKLALDTYFTDCGGVD